MRKICLQARIGIKCKFFVEEINSSSAISGDKMSSRKNHSQIKKLFFKNNRKKKENKSENHQKQKQTEIYLNRIWILDLCHIK